MLTVCQEDLDMIRKLLLQLPCSGLLAPHCLLVLFGCTSFFLLSTHDQPMILPFRVPRPDALIEPNQGVQISLWQAWLQEPVHPLCPTAQILALDHHGTGIAAGSRLIVDSRLHSHELWLPMANWVSLWKLPFHSFWPDSEKSHVHILSMAKWF